MTDAWGGIEASERPTTGVPNLDAVLSGGLFRRALYSVDGLLGTGKTILANQICFHHVASGGRALYLTLLTESHGAMLADLRSLAFFCDELIVKGLLYLSGYQVLAEEGLDGLMRFIQKEVRAHRATMLVIDDVTAAESLAESPVEFKRFLHGLRELIELMRAIGLLLTVHVGQLLHTVYAVVDGLLELSLRTLDARDVRDIELPLRLGASSLDNILFLRYVELRSQVYRLLSILKLRGSGYDTSLREFTITDAGIDVAATFASAEAILTGLARRTTPEPAGEL